MLAFKISKIFGNMKARLTAPQLSPKFPPRLFLIVCYQQISKDHFDRSLRRCGQLGSSFGCELLNGKQTICSQDGNDHLHCNDRHRGSYYWDHCTAQSIGETRVPVKAKNNCSSRTGCGTVPCKKKGQILRVRLPRGNNMDGTVTFQHESF